MKMRLSQLRSLIREAIIAEATISPALWTAMTSARHLKRLGSDYLRQFLAHNGNLDELLKITNNGNDIKYLGSGATGDAFSVGTGNEKYVLKMQMDKSGQSAQLQDRWHDQPLPHSKWQDVLFSGRAQKGQRIGNYLPMIYKTGKLIGPDGLEVNWGLMEVLTPIDKLLNRKETDELNDMMFKFYDLYDKFKGDSREIVAQMYFDPKRLGRREILNGIGSNPKLNLGAEMINVGEQQVPKWLLKLVEMMVKLSRALGHSSTDFNVSNLGVRKKSGWDYSELIFFD